mgnify:CR=1 FL=1
MKAILEFNLPYEQAEFDLTCRAREIVSALGDFAQRLREKRKYGQYSPEEQSAFDLVWVDLHQAFEGTGVEL